MGYIKVCDLCGEPIRSINGDHEFKVKKRWYSGPDAGWEKIDCHRECLCALLEKTREQKAILDRVMNTEI